jgi:hypothetical protein
MMVRTHETSYRDRLDTDVAMDVRFLTRGASVIDYAIVLLVRERGLWRAVRVYDNTHGVNDMHRYNRDGVKQPAETFHHGSAGEAMQTALDTVRGGYSETIESWRR